MKKFLPILFVLFFSLVANRALLAPGLPPTHDGEYHIIRFWEFYRTLTDGQWYPRWQPDLNYGYGSPLLNYYYPLPNYIASLMHFFGTSFIDALKLQMLFAGVLGGIFMYLWARIFWGELGGLVSSIFYIYSPYFFLDIHIRGSAGEVLALGIFPAFLWSCTKIIVQKKIGFVPISSILLALVIFSHNILGLMFFFFAIFYLIFLILDREQDFLIYQQNKDKKTFLVGSLYLVLLSLGLSSIFWLPAIFERHYVRGLEIFDYRQHFVEIYQLVFPTWGSGFSADPTTQGLSFQIGVANLLALALVLFVYFRTKYKNRRAIITFFISAVLVSIFLMLPISQPIWETVPLFRYFQFPWRLLSLVILFCAFLSGSLLYFWPKKILALILIGLAFILGIGYSQPAYYHPRDDSYYITRSNFIDGTNVPGNSFNTIWMNTKLRREKEKVKLMGEGDLKIDFIHATEYRFFVKASQDSEVIVNTAYFPGWTIFIDKIKTEVRPNSDGLISFPLSKGEYIIEVKLLNTAIRNLGQTLSILSAIMIFILLSNRLHARIKR